MKLNRNDITSKTRFLKQLGLSLFPTPKTCKCDYVLATDQRLRTFIEFMVCLIAHTLARYASKSQVMGYGHMPTWDTIKVGGEVW